MRDQEGARDPHPACAHASAQQPLAILKRRFEAATRDNHALVLRDAESDRNLEEGAAAENAAQAAHRVLRVRDGACG